MNDKNSGKSGRVRSGKARALALSDDARRDIASRAAKARWDTETPTATHIGELKIGDLLLPCAVLPDGTRLISQGGITTAFGPVTGGWQQRRRALDEHAGELPPFLVAASLKDYISNDLRTLVSTQRKYRDPRGGPVRVGMEASLLPKVCEVWLRARDAKALTTIQIPVAERADLLMRGLAHTGIVALVDEATGYQETRDREALQEILNAFLRAELAAWAKRFPDEFYNQIYRLKGWTRGTGRSSFRTPLLGTYTKNIVYERLAPGIIEELELRNPAEKGRRKSKHHQWLTDEIGHPALAQHLHAVITLMRVSKTWDQFKEFLDVAHPVRGDTLKLASMLEPRAPNIISAANDSLPLFEQAPRDAPA